MGNPARKENTAKLGNQDGQHQRKKNYKEELQEGCPLLRNLSTLYSTGKEFAFGESSQNGSNLFALHETLLLLNKTLILNGIYSLELKSFIVHQIGQVLSFVGEGLKAEITNVSAQLVDDLLPKIVHQILLLVKKKLAYWDIEISELFNGLKSLISILQSSTPKVGLNLIYWEGVINPNDSHCVNHPKKFTNCQNNPEEQKSFLLRYEDFSKLRYSTSLQNLRNIVLNASSKDGINLREMKGESETDFLCPQGFVTCEVDLGGESMKFGHVFENSMGGSFVIRFSLGDIINKDCANKFFKLGTRENCHEFVQFLLLSDRVEEDWWILLDHVISDRSQADNEDFSDVTNYPATSIFKMNPIEIHNLKWNIRNCISSVCGCWTTPKIIVSGGVKLELMDFKIYFECGHKCDETRGEKCIECGIAENRGKCWVKTQQNGWTKESGVKYRDYDLPIILFAESIPVKERGKIMNLQSEYRFFDVEQFGIIQHYWEENPEYWVMDWSLTGPT